MWPTKLLANTATPMQDIKKQSLCKLVKHDMDSTPPQKYSKSQQLLFISHIAYLGFPQTAPAGWSDQQLQYLQKYKYHQLYYKNMTILYLFSQHFYRGGWAVDTSPFTTMLFTVSVKQNKNRAVNKTGRSLN